MNQLLLFLSVRAFSLFHLMVQVKLKRFHTSGFKLTGASPVLHSRFSHSAAKSLLVGGVQRVMHTHG